MEKEQRYLWGFIIRAQALGKYRPSNPHGLTVRLTVWDAKSWSHSFGS